MMVTSWHAVIPPPKSSCYRSVFWIVVFCFLSAISAVHSEVPGSVHVAGNSSTWECHTVGSFSECCLRNIRSHSDEFELPQSANDPFVPSHLISSGAFRLVADVRYGHLHENTKDMRKLKVHKVPQLTDSMASCLPHGTIIWVDRPRLHNFNTSILPRLRAGVILITGGSNYGSPAEFRDLLSNSLILHWFAMHCDAPETPRFSCIPLGLDGSKITPLLSHLALRSVSSVSDLARTFRQKGNVKRGGILQRSKQNVSPTVLVSFNSKYAGRESIWKMFCQNSTWEGFAECLYDRTLSPSQFYEKAASMQFAISPSGFGVDCYRSWEMLYLGVMPVVLHSNLDPLYDDLPVVIMERWEDISPSLLQQKYFELTSSAIWINYEHQSQSSRNQNRGLMNLDRLQMSYWVERIRAGKS